MFADADGIPRWSPSQVLATNYCVCKCMRCDVCNCFVWYLLWRDTRTFYQLSLLKLQVTLNSSNVTQTIVISSVPETKSIREMTLRNVAEAGA